MPIERETIITDSGRSTGTSSGILIGVAIVVLLLIIVGGLTVFNGGFSMGGKSVTLDVPKVTVSK
jgi:hypothetical protein